MLCACFFCKTKLSNPAPTVNVQFWLCGPEGHLETAASDMHKSPPSFSSTDFSGLTSSEQNRQLEEKRQLSYVQDLHHFKGVEDQGGLYLHPAPSRGEMKGLTTWDAPRERVPPLLAPARHSHCTQALGTSRSCGHEAFLLCLSTRIPHRHSRLNGRFRP